MMPEEPIVPVPPEGAQPADTPQVRSLRELIERVSVRGVQITSSEADAGLAEQLPFPFLALVGQPEMKLALLIGLVNPLVGGVLLVGPRGTGKTTAVRSLVDLLPEVPRSLCYYGCMPEDIETGGIDAVCPECAAKYGRGEPLAALDRVRLVELPLNARIEDVVGSLDERAAVREHLRIRKGILAQADRNLLYIDEVNLLSGDVVDAILDAAALGSYTVRRGAVAANYRSRFVLIGSMNPEEGRLRPQIMDRFGLRVILHGLDVENSPEACMEAYRRVRLYQTNPRQMASLFAEDTGVARQEVQTARELVSKVNLPDDVARLGLRLVAALKLDSLRAQITLLEAARAYTALDGRDCVSLNDLREVAPMCLRLRRSMFMEEFFTAQSVEEDDLHQIIRTSLGEKLEP
jgi:magnesium chelatase subunit I